MNLLMISGDRSLAQGKKGAFYNTLEELHKHFDQIDIITPPITNYELRITNLFGNVFIHPSPWPLLLQPIWILKEGLRILRPSSPNPNYRLPVTNYSSSSSVAPNSPKHLAPSNWLMTVHEYPPFYNGLGACMLNWKTKIPYMLEIFHIPGFPKSSGIKESVYRIFTQLYIRSDAHKARAVRVMNSDVGNFLEKCGVSPDKIKLIPAIYLDLDIFKPITNLPVTNYSSKDYDLIFVGRLEQNKGLDLLLEAIKLLTTNYQLKPKTLIVGDGSLRDWVQSQITNYQLPVTLFGFAKDSAEIAHLLNMSRILVMPSYNEGGPRVVVEAMACGVPILATPVGIVPDLLKNGLGGEIIGWNAKDIASKAKALLTDPEMYQKHSLAALELAKNFEKKEAIKNVADKLKKVIGNQ